MSVKGSFTFHNNWTYLEEKNNQIKTQQFLIGPTNRQISGLILELRLSPSVDTGKTAERLFCYFLREGLGGGVKSRVCHTHKKIKKIVPQNVFYAI